MAKPIKSLELHYPMIQFLIITVRLDRTCNGMEAHTGISLSFMLVSSATVRIRIFRLVNVMDPYWSKFHYCVEGFHKRGNIVVESLLPEVVIGA